MQHTHDDILLEFDPISLKEMDSVALLNRTDTKFLFKKKDLPDVLERILPFYRVLNVHDQRISSYETVYFDTDDYRLFMQHHNGKLNRYKVRYRQYCDSDLTFFEIKFKNNHERTIKSRIKRKCIESLVAGDAGEFLKLKTGMDPLQLSPKLRVYYSRITLVGITRPERLTIDLNLTFKNESGAAFYPGLVIGEIKQDRSGASAFASVMKHEHIRQGGMSKYCLGIASVENDVKHNNFKPKINFVKKLCDEQP